MFPNTILNKRVSDGGFGGLELRFAFEMAPKEMTTGEIPER